MKLPKTVNICGKPYNVHKDRKLFGGSGQTGAQEVVIGTKFGKSARIFDNFIHEIAECIACERNFRYDKGTSDGSLFVMTHKEFDCFASDMAAAIMPMVKK